LHVSGRYSVVVGLGEWRRELARTRRQRAPPAATVARKEKSMKETFGGTVDERAGRTQRPR
jgi:hypothetical protein